MLNGKLFLILWIGPYYIFDSAGNHFRLIAAIHFNTQTVYIRAVLTH